MEMMNYSEKRKKSLKGPIFAITSFLVVGTGVITYAMINEKEPVVIGNQGSLLTGEIPVSIEEENSLKNLTEESLDDMYEIKINLVTDSSNEHIKSEMSIPFVYIDDTELKEFNDMLRSKFENSFNSFKESMSSVEHNFTYRVNYESYQNIVKDNAVLSIIITEKMTEDGTENESMNKKYTYNIDLLTGENIKQSDIIVDMLGSSYKDGVKEAICNYLVNDGIIKKEEYNYAYTGLENFYIKDGKELHFIFNARRFSR